MSHEIIIPENKFHPWMLIAWVKIYDATSIVSYTYLTLSNMIFAAQSNAMLQRKILRLNVYQSTGVDSGYILTHIFLSKDELLNTMKKLNVSNVASLMTPAES